MLNQLTVRDFYIHLERYPHLRDDTSVCEAIRLIFQMLKENDKFRTILIHDEENHLRGYLTIRDLIRALGPRYMRKSAPNYRGNQPFQEVETDITALSLIWQESFGETVMKEAEKPVSEVMTLVEESVTLEDHFAKVVTLMLVKDVVVLPVVQEELVIGAVRLVDAFELIANRLCEEKHKQEAD